jgi:type IV pilus assembly protein PilY1
MLLPEMHKLAASNYDVNHRFYVDGSPTAMDVFINSEWRTILVGGLNAGGRGFYALDVTDPTSTGVKALWEFCHDPALCAISDPDLGFSFGQPIISKRASDGRWVVIVTSGYNNVSPGSGGGFLYVLDAATGAILSKTGTDVAGVNVGDATTPSGLAKASGFAVNFTVNNTTTFVYSGDLLGNVWRFDMQTDPPTAQRIGQAFDNSSPPRPQSITTRPEITRFDAGFNVIYVGTGRYLGASDIPDANTLTPPPVPTWAYQQTVYAFKDTGADLGNLRATGAKLQVQTMSVLPDGVSRTISNNKVDWNTMNGWFVDLNPANDSPGERINIDMQLVRGVLVVAANEPNNEACSTGGNSFLYFFDYQSGSYVASSPGQVVGTRLSQALAAGFVVYRLQNGQLKFAEINVNGTKKVGGVPPGSGGALGRRVSWRELF